MKKWLILTTLLVVGALFVPAVSAELLTDNVDNSIDWSIAGSGYTINPSTIRIFEASDWIGLNFVYFNGLPSTGDYEKIIAEPYWEQPVNIVYGESVIGSGTAYYNGLFRTDGTVSGIQFWIDIDTIDMRDISGNTLLSIVPTDGRPLWNGVRQNGATSTTWQDTRPIHFSDAAGHLMTGIHIARSDYYWQNNVTIDNHNIIVDRVFDDSVYYSNVTVITSSGATSDLSSHDITIPYVNTAQWIITNAKGTVFTGNTSATLTPELSSQLTVYVRASQTNALISNARVVIEAGFNDPADLQEVSNTTLPSGTKTYTLQPNGGGLPNPDYYRVSVTADGYNAEMPYADITLDAGVSMTMVMGMEPTAGGPEDPGKTYIDVYVRDIYANPISDATVKMGDYTLKTNSAGYTLFDVPVNSTYTYTITKPGYITIEGTVTVANAPRYPVNIVMGLGLIPTNTPTAEPTVPGATPTVPAGEETPGTGFMEESGQAMATFFGVPLAIGKMILGMLIALAIGMATAKQLKGGAQEFGIGLLGGAMLGVVVGLIPTWVIVVLLLTVGLYIGKMYMAGDAGGR